MTPKEFPYTRLPGRQRGFVRKSSLWQGADHILLVQGTRFSEEYRRFHYGDIQVLLVQKCARSGSIGLWLLNILAILLAMVAFSGNRFPKSITGSILLVVLLPAVARLWMAFRYSCRCFVQTGVSREELPSLYRTWTAKKALSQLREKIVEAQGAPSQDVASLLASAEAEEHDKEKLTHPLSNGEGLSGQGMASPDTASRTVNLAIWAFLLLLVNAVRVFWFLDGPTAAASTVWARTGTAILSTVTIGLTFLSLLGTNKRRSLHLLRRLLFVVLFFEWLEIYATMFLDRTYSVQKGVVTITVAGQRAWGWAGKIDGGLCVVLGIFALIFVLWHWQTFHRGDTSAA